MPNISNLLIKWGPDEIKYYLNNEKANEITYSELALQYNVNRENVALIYPHDERVIYINEYVAYSNAWCESENFPNNFDMIM